jgi:hypothetical protein
MANDNFWIIFDTCTRPEYYQDVHNILALPKNSIVRYNYNIKYLDSLSEKYLENDEFPKKVLLMYGEFDGYQKGVSIEKFKDFRNSNQDFFVIPTRICELKNLQKINGEVYFDLELQEYPYSENSSNINDIIKSLDGAIPFNNKGKYIAISGSINEYNFLKTSGDNKSNWSAIIKLFQDKSQFKDDSFWRIEGPYKKNGEKIPPKVTYDKESKSSYLNHYVINEGKEFYFNLYNYEPHSNVKYELLLKKVSEGANYEDFVRKIKINDDYSPVISFLKEINLRQYFVSKIKFQRNYNSDLLTKEGACYFNTLGQTDQWPIGANFYLYFQLRKNPLSIVLAILLILAGVGFGLYSKYIVDTNIKCAITYALISSLSFITSSFILYRQIKTKI